MIWIDNRINKRNNGCCQRSPLLIGSKALPAAKLLLKQIVMVRRLCSEWRTSRVFNTNSGSKVRKRVWRNFCVLWWNSWGWEHTLVTTALRKLRQEDSEFKVGLGCMLILCPKVLLSPLAATKAKRHPKEKGTATNTV